MRALLLSIVMVLAGAWPFHAAGDEPGRVAGWGSCAVTPPPLPEFDTGPPTDEIEVLSGRAEFQFDGNALFRDGIVLRQGDRFLRADGASYDRSAGEFAIDGTVEYQDSETLVRATDARLNQVIQELRFSRADFQIWSVPARGSAESVKLSSAGKLSMDKVVYTSCPEGKDDWLLKASRIRIDQQSGVGTARNARLQFKGVPILYLPWVSYPATNQRKTGWLIPDLGSSDQRGVDVAAPWYWNIAPNYDATITPRYMSKRGLQMGGEFRYLLDGHGGELTGEYLKDDDANGEDRSLVSLRHESALARHLRGVIDAANVSDSAYFEDFGSGLASTSQTHLRRRLDLEYYSGPWSALLRVQDFQTIDDAIVSEDKPYKRLPQLAVRGYSPDGLFGLTYALDGDLTWFDRNTGVTGLRAYVAPEIALPFNYQIFEVTPKATWTYTRYDLDQPDPAQPEDPDRSAPIFGVNIETLFERDAGGGRWLQTLEPRVLYTYIPFRDQDDLPVFDTIEPDLNIVQLFRQNRFAGYDRLGDTSQLAFGVTTRLLEASDGSQFLNATIGQLLYFSNQDVTLPDGQPSDSSSSDYLAELGTRFAESWRVDLGFQWNSDESETRKAEARVQYRPTDNKVVNLSYRFRRDALEEIDLALAWPLSERWNLVGRYDYSLLDSEPLERFVGLEYETCCWGIRAVWRRNLTRRSGESDTSISLQLMLKGFSSPSTAAEDLLDRGILGYDR